jgi:hypothetical protein
VKNAAAIVVVDVGARLVRRDGVVVHLAPKAFDLLMILVRNQPNMSNCTPRSGPACMSPRRALRRSSRSFAKRSATALKMVA